MQVGDTQHEVQPDADAGTRAEPCRTLHLRPEDTWLVRLCDARTVLTGHQLDTTPLGHVDPHVGVDVLRNGVSSLICRTSSGDGMSQPIHGTRPR